ncbi:MAG: GntR family transcriptional regulator [Congregibacter sp.]|nr:GntR family transcriptional regulator [Congregibacter sp.]
MQVEQVRKRAHEGPQGSSRVPLYRKIADTLLAGIREGKFPVGTFLPGELELIDRFDASRHTIREALRVLEDMGLVKRQRGRGTLVLSTEASPAFVQMVRSPSELFSYPDSSIFRLLSDDRIRADKPLAKELGCQVGDEWVQISGLRTLGDEGMPICLTDVYVIPEYGSIAQRLGASSRPVYEMIAETFKESIENITVRLTAGVLSDQKAAVLGVEPGSPSLSVSRFYEGLGGRTFEVSISEHPASNYSYTFEFTRGWQTADHWSWNN